MPEDVAQLYFQEFKVMIFTNPDEMDIFHVTLITRIMIDYRYSRRVHGTV